MTDYERKNWIINIENSAAAVEAQLGSSVVNSVFAVVAKGDTWCGKSFCYLHKSRTYPF